MSTSKVLSLWSDLEGKLGDIPAWLALGWIDVESGGHIDSSGSASLDERGYFQVSREENRYVSPHEDLSSNPDKSLEAGIALIGHYREQLHSAGMVEEDTAFWMLVKLCHQIGGPGTLKLVREYIADEGSPPGSWEDFISYALKNPIKSEGYITWGKTGVEKLRTRGLLLSGLLNLPLVMPAAVLISDNPTTTAIALGVLLLGALVWYRWSKR